jgi:hypothetical protein
LDTLPQAESPKTQRPSMATAVLIPPYAFEVSI